ncbi:cytochrome c oxidase subunit 1 [Apophysomyces sp. BC1034]|nr:cytochrome c oxidase subunit 1 [Apophysomyces sp. BC1034]
MNDGNKGRIILVGGEKGGSAKTTMAVNLAVLSARSGRDTLLVDTDPQGSASDWTVARDEEIEKGIQEGNANGSPPRIACLQKFGKGLARELEDLSTRYEEIIVDAGGRDSVELRAAMTKAEVMVSPIQASSFDLWTLRRLDELVRQAQAFNSDLKVLVVISRAPTNPSVTDTTEAAELVSEYETFSLARHPVRERIAFRRSAGQGLGVVEYDPADKKAIFEINALYKEISNEHAIVEPYPWEGLDDKKRREPFNIRFTDAEKAMLKFVEENGRDSMHAFCVSVLRPALRQKIEEITGKKLEGE